MEGKHGPTQPVEGTLSERSRYRPFGLHWMDSALQETLLPGSPWEQVQGRISENLAQSLDLGVSVSKEERQMILNLLGQQFVQKYMSNILYRPDVLDPSVLSEEKRKQLQLSAQVYLKDKLDSVLKDLGYARPSSRGSTAISGRARLKNQESSDMRAVVDHGRGIFKTGLERNLVIQEMSSKKEHNEFKEKSKLQLTSNASDALGQSLLAILRRDPGRLDSICQRLAGQQLPASLRGYVWREILFSMVDDGGTSREKISEKQIRKRFAKAVSKGKVDMKITKATECPIGGLIETAVKEKYEATPCMKAHKQDKLRLHTREVLNVLYTYNKSYEPFLIHWIFPLQVAFQGEAHKEEHPYELALYLDFLQTYAFPKWPEIFAVAEQVMARLQRVDEALYSHLQECSVTNVKVDPQEFLVHLIDAEKKKAAALSWSTGGTDATHKASEKIPKELLANPLIFLRKWVGEGFVGVLSRQAMLYIWDQFFLERWDRQVMEHTCLALLLQLRAPFMRATNYHQMRQVFLSEPSKTLTLDLVKAYRQARLGQERSMDPGAKSPVAKAAAPTPIPIPATPPGTAPATAPGSTPATAPGSAPGMPPAGPIDPQPEMVKLRRAGLRNIKLKLIWNLTESQLPGLQMDRVVVTLFLTVGKKTVQVNQIKDHVTLSIFVKKSDGRYDKDSPGKIIQTVNEEPINFSLKELDLMKYDRELEPLVALRFRYKTSDDESDHDQDQLSKESLGWALIPVYQKEGTTSPQRQNGTAVPMTTWAAREAEQTVPLYFGEVPEDIQADGAMKQFSGKDLLQVGSEVSLTVFEPDTLWLEQDPSRKEDDHKATAPEEGCDLYIDGVRFLPDTSTICKVTGRVVLPVNDDRPDILAAAEFDSSARCPTCTYRYTLPFAEEANVAVLRIYTVDKVTNDVVVAGATALQLFVGDEGSKKLNIGGFQLRMHHGMPASSAMSVEAMSQLPIIPACSLLVRLLPKSEEFIPAPDYDTAYYDSHTCVPSESERRLMVHYRKNASWGDTVRSRLHKLRQDQQETQEMTEDELRLWQLDRLDFKKQSDPENQAPPQRLDIVRCVDYDQEMGLFLEVQSAKAVQAEGMYTNVIAHVLPGSDVTSGRDKELLLVQEVKPSSPQAGPVFNDDPKKLHPAYSTKSYLLLQVFGLSVTYKPDPSNKGPGTMHSKDSTRPVSLEPESRLGWTILPLFDKGCVAQGIYSVPIFEDNGKFPFLKDMTQADDLWEWIARALKEGTITLSSNHASLVLSLWDGHFDKVDTIPLPREEMYLSEEDFQMISEAADKVGGPTVSDLILQNLPAEVQGEGVGSETYWLEEGRFQEVIKSTFKDVIEMAELIQG